MDEKVKKIEKLSKEIKTQLVDLTTEEDLMFAIMNLISLEEHFFMTYVKTNKEIYLQFHDEIRNLRKTCMEKLVKNVEGELWCISKHLLSTSMRLKEVADKIKDKKFRKFLYQCSFEMLKIFKLLHKLK